MSGKQFMQACVWKKGDQVLLVNKVNFKTSALGKIQDETSEKNTRTNFRLSKAFAAQATNYTRLVEPLK